MKRSGAAVAILTTIAQALAAAQDGPRKLPPPLHEVFADSEREYYSLAFSPDAGTLAAGAGGAVRILTVGGEIVEAKVLKQHGRVDDLLFNASARVLISRSRDQDALVWETDSWAPVKYSIRDFDVGGLAIRAGTRRECDPSASTLVLSNRARGLRLWGLDGLRGKPRSVAQIDVRTWEGITLGRVTAVAWAGPALLAGDDQGYVYRLPEAQKLLGKLNERDLVLGGIVGSTVGIGMFRPHQGEVTAIALAAEAQRAVTAGMDEKVRLWDLAKIPGVGAPRGRAAPEPQWEIAGQVAEISPDGRLLAVADAEGVGVYQAASGVALSWNPTVVRGGRVVRLRFDPGGKLLAGILCRCPECVPGKGGAVSRARRRLADHGGRLVMWK